MVATAQRRRTAHLDARRLGSALLEAANTARGNCIGDAASVIAYNAIIALPAVVLSTLGLLVAVGGQGAVDGMLRTAGNVLPPDAISLLRGTLNRAVENRGSGIAFAALGIVLAIWSAMGAMGAVMRGLNRVYRVDERRGAVRRLGSAFAMLALTVVAACLTAGLLALGPVLSNWLGRVSGHPDAARILWWTAQWPLTLAVLVLVFAGMIAIGPDVRSRRRGLVTGGAGIAVVLWIALSLVLALYVSHFSSYNKAWGSLSAIIVTIVWMRLSALALLFGAELDAAIERRSRV
jgi:membrane protein